MEPSGSNAKHDIYARTKAFAVRVVKLAKYLEEHGGVGRKMNGQLLRAGTSIGANYREAKSAESTADFLHKLQIALKEARETEYWLEVIEEGEVMKASRLTAMRRELDELTRILVATVQSTRKRKQV